MSEGLGAWTEGRKELPGRKRGGQTLVWVGWVAQWMRRVIEGSQHERSESKAWMRLE